MFNLFRRQDATWQSSNDDDDDGQWWGYSATGTAIKWGVVGAIVLIIFIWLVGGYYHAQRRIKRGQTPMAYHMFLVPRHQRARFVPQPPFSFYQNQGYRQEYPVQYPMHAYPPPAYNAAEQAAPPMYQPPEGSSKIKPNQDYAVPPPGPPPGHADIGESSSAMRDVPLHQDPTTPHDHNARPHIQDSKPGFTSRLNPFKRYSSSK